MTLEKPHLPTLVLRSFDEPLTYERWLTLPDDDRIIRQISLLLIEQLDRQAHGLTSWAPIGLLMPGCNPVQPDIVVVRPEDCDMIYDGRIHAVPALIVEVLSSGNSSTDTQIKRAAYARAGLPEYWIVRPAERDVIVLSQPDPSLGDYLQTRSYAGSSELIAATLPFCATVSDFFAGSALRTKRYELIRVSVALQDR